MLNDKQLPNAPTIMNDSVIINPILLPTLSATKPKTN